MWTSCPSETLPGSVSPSPPRLITLLIFINSWGFFMPCRPEIEREEARGGGGGVLGGDRDGGRDATPLHSTTTTTTTAAGAQCWKQQLGDPCVPQGIYLGPPALEAFCQLRATRLQGQFGRARPSQPWRHQKTNPCSLAGKHL